jgi:uncharacterized protein DUF6193
MHRAHGDHHPCQTVPGEDPGNPTHLNGRSDQHAAESARADVRAAIALTAATLSAVNDELAEALLTRWTDYRSLLADDHSWVGEALAPVIEAAFVTPELRALFPFTSVNSVCFSRCSDWPYTGDCPCIFGAGEREYIVLAWWYASDGSDEPAPELIHTTDLELAITTVIDNLPADRAVWLGDRDHRPD